MSNLVFVLVFFFLLLSPSHPTPSHVSTKKSVRHPSPCTTYAFYYILGLRRSEGCNRKGKEEEEWGSGEIPRNEVK